MTNYMKNPSSTSEKIIKRLLSSHENSRYTFLVSHSSVEWSVRKNANRLAVILLLQAQFFSFSLDRKNAFHLNIVTSCLFRT